MTCHTPSGAAAPFFRALSSAPTYTGGNPAIGILIPVANGFEEFQANTPFSADKQSF